MWWAYVGGYAVIAAGTARVFFLWNEDSKDSDIKTSAGFAGLFWPLVWVILGIGYTSVGIGKVVFAPSKKKRRAAARLRAEKAEAERVKKFREAQAIIDAAPAPAAIYPATDGWPDGWHPGTGAGE